MKKEPSEHQVPVKQEPKVPVKQEPQKEQVGPVVYETDYGKLEMTRSSDEGSETVKLQKGDEGAFLIAKFKNEQVQSELPNLFLDLPASSVAPKKGQKKKKPAAKKGKAKAKGKSKTQKKHVSADAPGGVPPAAGPAPADPNIGELEAAPAPEKPEDYEVMWYKATKTIGIRKKGGKKQQKQKQIVSFGGVKVEKDKAAMKHIGVKVVKMLITGKSPAEAKVEGNRLTFAE